MKRDYYITVRKQAGYIDVERVRGNVYIFRLESHNVPIGIRCIQRGKWVIDDLYTGLRWNKRPYESEAAAKQDMINCADLYLLKMREDYISTHQRDIRQLEICNYELPVYDFIYGSSTKV